MKVEHANERLFQKLVGKKLRRVLDEVGFPEVPPTVFDGDDVFIFQQQMDKLPTSHQEATTQLVRSLHRGKVTMIHTLVDGKTRLTVHFTHLDFYCAVQLIHCREHWETSGTPTVMKMPRSRALPLAFIVTSAVIGLGGFWLGASGLFQSETEALSEEAMIQQMEAQGYAVMTPEEQDDLIAIAEKNGYEKAQQQLAQREAQVEKENKENKRDGSEQKSKKDEESKKEKKDNEDNIEDKKFHFTMKEGMTTVDLLEALEENGLVDDAFAFGQKLEKSGIATKIRPGKYTFSTDMSEKEIMKQLERD